MWSAQRRESAGRFHGNTLVGQQAMELCLPLAEGPVTQRNTRLETLDPHSFHPRQLSIYVAYIYKYYVCLMSSFHNITVFGGCIIVIGSLLSAVGTERKDVNSVVTSDVGYLATSHYEKKAGKTVQHLRLKDIYVLWVDMSFSDSV